MLQAWKFAAAAALSAVTIEPVGACTRALYVADNGLVITGRTMDWAEDMHTDLWAFRAASRGTAPAERVRRNGRLNTAASSQRATTSGRPTE